MLHPAIHRAGASLTDLCVAMVLFALLLFGAMPHLGTHAREQANQIKCASNLRNIAQHGFMYANQDTRHGKKFPRTYFDPAGPLDRSLRGGANDNPTNLSFSGIDPPQPVGVNNVQASFFLMLKATELTAFDFICPSSEAQKAYAESDPHQFSNWPAPYPQFNSYSYTCPFPTSAAISAGWKFDTTLGPETPFASDINPGDRNGAGPTRVAFNDGRKAIRAGNSPNHWFNGQQVAYADGHVEFQTSPFAGAIDPVTKQRDNIFTADAAPGTAGGTIWVMPNSATDNVLLPTALDSPGNAEIATRTTDMTEPNEAKLTRSMVIAGGLVIAVAAATILFVVLRRKTPQRAVQ